MAKRIYIAFMGCPLAPVQAVCSCGQKTVFGQERSEWPKDGEKKISCTCGAQLVFGSDKKGWYVEGAERIIIEGSKRAEDMGKD